MKMTEAFQIGLNEIVKTHNEGRLNNEEYVLSLIGLNLGYNACLTKGNLSEEDKNGLVAIVANIEKLIIDENKNNGTVAKLYKNGNISLEIFEKIMMRYTME